MNENSEDAVLDKDIVREFWQSRAQTESNRWTSESFLAHEVEMLSPYGATADSILDVGSGHGELSRTLAGSDTTLVALDLIPDYSSSFADTNHEFVCGTVNDLSDSRNFDLVLAMGIVTYLTQQEEVELYTALKALMSDTGVVVVKNQCALADEFVVNGYSEQLGSNYSGRYPNLSEQYDRLGTTFNAVEIYRYPASFNSWRNSAHVAFICH